MQKKKLFLKVFFCTSWLRIESIFLPLKIFIHRSTEVRVRQITDCHRDGNNISLEFKNPVMAHQAIS